MAESRKRPVSSRQGPIEFQSDVAKKTAEIKAAISVRDFVSQYVELSPSGRGLCPFHDDHHPSFNVNDEENYWYCFACEKGGSIINFWMQWNGYDYVTAVLDLSSLLANTISR